MSENNDSMWISVIISKLLREENEIDTKALEGKVRMVEDIINRNLALQKVKITGVRKIAITLTLEKDKNLILEPIKGFSPVVNITKTFDFRLFNTLADEEQNENLLSVIEHCLRDAAEKFGWTEKPFREIASIVRELGFKHSYLEWKLKSSKDKKHKAGVQVNMLPDEASISIVFYSYDERLVSTVKLIGVRPDRFFVAPLLGKCMWLSNTEFELVDRKGEIHFRASLSKNTAKVYLTPVNRTADDVIDDLLILAASTNNAQALSLLQARIDDRT